MFFSFFQFDRARILVFQNTEKGKEFLSLEKQSYIAVSLATLCLEMKTEHAVL